MSLGLEQAIADETGASVADAIWADALGPDGSDGETYIDAMASNTEKLVDGFTQGAQSCDIDVGSGG
ncbi:MAG: hypothetical protein WKF62_01780 [Solirubrobacterales bacterium]